MSYNKILTKIAAEIAPLRNQGKQADYIPALAKVDPDHFGICITTTSGKSYGWGDIDTPFSIQSVSKVFSLSIP